MTATELALTDEERSFLAELLQRSIKEKRIEEHRTRTPTYREHLVHEEELIKGLLQKLGMSSV
jgi:hypothetical protein